MQTEKIISKKQVTLESIADSIEKIDESIKASEDRLSTKIISDLTVKIDDSFDELARMTQGEFVQIGKRFGTLETKVDDGFAGVDRKFVDVQSQLDHIYNNYPMRREHELLSGRVSKIERRFHMAHR